MISFTDNTDISLQTNANYIDLGTSFQLTCTIATGPNNSIHLHRQSGVGSTCGVWDQLLVVEPPHEAGGLCTEDTNATYAISCAWNADSTVMTFTVDNATSLELTEWRCDSRNSLSTSVVTIVKFGKLNVEQSLFVDW